MADHNPTLRVLNILELLDMNAGGFGLSEIAERLDLPKGTISPILKTLTARGYIRFSGGVYSIGFKAFELGLSFSSQTDAVAVIRGEMRDIVRSVGEICQMGVLSGLNVLYMLKESSNTPITIISEVGKRVPAHVTGIGKALLSGKSDEELREMFKGYSFTKYTANSITDLDVLLGQIRDVRAGGLAFESEESTENICCVAAPLEIDDMVQAAFSVTVPKFRFDAEKRERISQILLQKKKLIEDICRVQGYRLDMTS